MSTATPASCESGYKQHAQTLGLCPVIMRLTDEALFLIEPILALKGAGWPQCLEA